MFYFKRKEKAKKISFLARDFCFSLLFFLNFFVFLAGSASEISAQNFDSFSEQIRTGNIEQKREILFRIRNIKTAEASRIAVPALRDKNEIIRATAAFSVIYLPKSEASQQLLPNLLDKSELVRRETAYALGKIGDSSAVGALLQVLNKDKNTEVRAAAAIALGEIGEVPAIGGLIKVLQRKPVEDEEFLRRAAARSIGQIAQIVQTNDETVLTPQNFLPDRYKDLKPPKYSNLENQFPVFAQAAEILRTALQNDREADDTRREAAFSLGAIGDETAIPILKSKINDKDYYLAEIAEEALRKIDYLQSLKNK